MNDSEQLEVHVEPGEVGLVAFVDFVDPTPFHFERGGSIPELRIRYESYGHLNDKADNAILICHALSGDHHCAGYHSLDDRKAGWWNHMIGPGKPIDTTRFFVLCSNCIGGCQGSVGPSSINPETGQRYNLDFPELTVGDMVEAQARLLRHLGITRLHAIVGGSMGGMQALEWITRFPESTDRYIALATGARHTAQAIAFNDTGRQAILTDPGWKNGAYATGEGPAHGLAVARMMAHITYLSDKGMETKFGRNRRRSEANGSDRFEVEFEVESYLRYQGQSFVNRFDANTYLYFTKALDHFDLYGPENRLDDTLAVVEAKGLVIGFTSDWLYPPQGNREIVEALLRLGKHASYAELAMDFGHDSFLVHAPALYELIASFLNQ